MTKGIVRQWIPPELKLTLTLHFLFFSNSVKQVLPQPPYFGCNEAGVPINFCATACGANADAQCVDGNCICRPNCYTGGTPTPPAALSGNCPLAMDAPLLAGIVANCMNGCPPICAGGNTGQICGDPNLNLMNGANQQAMICACPCPALACPATPINNANIIFVLTKILTKKYKLFLITVKTVYGLLFFLGKILITQLVAIAWAWYLLTFGEFFAEALSAIPFRIL